MEQESLGPWGVVTAFVLQSPGPRLHLEPHVFTVERRRRGFLERVGQSMVRSHKLKERLRPALRPGHLTPGITQFSPRPSGVGTVTVPSDG